MFMITDSESLVYSTDLFFQIENFTLHWNVEIAIFPR